MSDFIKETTSKFTNNLPEIVNQLESCGYNCDGGPLENNTAFIELRRMAADENTNKLRERITILEDAIIAHFQVTAIPLDMMRPTEKTMYDLVIPLADLAPFEKVILKSIGDVSMGCPNCGWRGKFDECEPDRDGDGSPGCPNCDSVVYESLKGG